MIITCKKHIPLHWIFVICLPTATFMFMYPMMGTAALFSMKKFLDNPAGLTFIMSLPGILSIVLAPSIQFLSDRIWTRFGRRKPFVVTGWIIATVCVALMPVMPSFWLLLVAFMGYNVALDIMGPSEPLKLEVVPPSMRGRSVAFSSWLSQFGLLMFFFLALGRFDDHQYYLGVPLSGEASLYWAAASGMTLVILIISLGVKEVDPKSRLRGERFNVQNFFRGILSRDLWPVYTLIFGSAMLGAGLGVMGNLLYTEQWRFTKQEMGNNIAIGGVINLFLIAGLGYFADKLNRIRAYQTLIICSLAVNAAFYCYVNFVLYDQRPGLFEMVLFGEVLSIIGILTGMVYTPLVYDYVPRNEMGTFMAGSNLLGRLTGLVTLNGVGLFVWAYATIFLPPGGDMARVVFRDSIHHDAALAQLRAGTWTDPANGALRPPAAISAEPWYASGAVLDHGRCYEVRLANPDSVNLKKARDKLDEKRAELERDAAATRARAELASRDNPSSPKAVALLARASALQNEIDPLVADIARKDAELARRGQSLRGQIFGQLSAVLLAPGEQIRAANVAEGTVLELATLARPSGDALEKLIDPLRRAHPEIIDLRPVKTETGYGIALGVAGRPDAAAKAALANALNDLAPASLKQNLIAPVQPRAERTMPMLTLDLVTIEEPLDIHLSPVYRATNAVLGFFTAPPGPERRLSAMGRSLRLPGHTDQVSVRDLSSADADDHAIRVRALLEPVAAVETSAASADRAAGNHSELPAEITTRLATLLSSGDSEKNATAAAFYARVVTAGKEQRITLAEPGQHTGFAAMKYDYMAGYLWMLILGSIGFVITVAFCRREARGLIRKRGLEEAAGG